MPDCFGAAVMTVMREAECLRPKTNPLAEISSAATPAASHHWSCDEEEALERTGARTGSTPRSWGDGGELAEGESGGLRRTARDGFNGDRVCAFSVGN